LATKKERRKRRRIPIAFKIFAGFVIAMLFMLVSNFFLIHRLILLRQMVKETGESVDRVASERHILDCIIDLDREYGGYLLALAQYKTAPDEETKDYIEECPEQMRAELAAIRILVDSLYLPQDSLTSRLYAYLDTLAVSIEPIQNQLWEHSRKNLGIVVRTIRISEQRHTEDLIAKSHDITSSSWKYGVGLSLVMLLLSGAMAIFIAGLIARPIAHLRRATHYARLGKYRLRVPIETRDEVGDLTADFNAMLDALNKLDKMKAMFLASITHDLKSPLYRVKLGLENLEDGIHGALSPEQNKALHLLLTDIDTLSRLIYDILDLQKMEDGKFELNKENVELEQFIRETVKKHSISFADKGVGLALRLNVEDVNIQLDMKQIERVFENLMSNALKFTPQGGKVVVIAEKKGHSIQFGISDSGQGIAPDEIDKVFGKFFRASGGKNVRGTGLGLAIAKQIVVAHKGRIWLESELCIGTTFFFVLPIRKN